MTSITDIGHDWSHTAIADRVGGWVLRNDEFHEIFTKSEQLAYRRRAVGGVSGSEQFQEIS